MSMIQYADISVVVLIFLLIMYWLRKTDALNLLFGIIMVYGLSKVAQIAGLTNTSGVLGGVATLWLVGSVFLYYAELRIALKKFGRKRRGDQENDKWLDEEIMNAVFAMSQQKMGALIILDDEKSIDYHSDNLVAIGANCSKELLMTIFNPNAELHDGAVIIQRGRIAYAGCKLPISGRKRDDGISYGTRHLAAMESSEQLGVRAIVVSEETGTISMVNNGKVKKIQTIQQYKNGWIEG